MPPQYECDWYYVEGGGIPQQARATQRQASQISLRLSNANKAMRIRNNSVVGARLCVAQEFALAPAGDSQNRPYTVSLF